MSRAAVAFEVLRWSVGWWLLWRVPVPLGRLLAPDLSRVSVVIPARNEESNLRRLLPSLPAGLGEVIVVDDGSDDATAGVARDAGVVALEAGPLPPGWTGKAWACATGASRARGELIVFLDADTVVDHGGLERIVAEHGGHGGLVSVQPYHVPERPYERLSAYFNLVAMMGVDAFTPLQRRLSPTGAFGPCLVVPRSTYLAAGGHEAVRAEVLDDVSLARAVRSVGERVTLFGGRGSLGFRMYPDGLRQMVEGWTKNFATAAVGIRLLTLILVVVWISGSISAGWFLGTRTPGAGAAVYAAYSMQLGLLLRRVGRFGLLTAALFPLPLAFFLMVFLRSALLTFVRRQVRWRGRVVELPRSRRLSGRRSGGSSPAR